MIFHRRDIGLSVASEVDEDGRIWFALAACHPRDEFNKHYANIKLNGRLDSRKEKSVVGLMSLYDESVKPFNLIRDFVRSMDEKGEVRKIAAGVAGAFKSKFNEMEMSRRTRNNSKVGCCGGTC